MFKALTLLTALLSASSVSAAVLSLTSENFDAKTSGKTVFLKCFAPWCGHCQAMAEDWEKLAKDWEKHEIGLVAEIDCTNEEAQDLCERFQVQGFPTLVYGDPSAPEQYNGGRDYESLSAFAKENISKPIYSVTNIDVCDDDEKKIIKDLQGKSRDDLLALNTKYTEGVAKLQEGMEKFIEELTAQYEKANDEMQKNMDELTKETNNKYVRQVLAAQGVDLTDDFKEEL